MEIPAGTLDLNSLDNGTVHVVITNEEDVNQECGTEILQNINTINNSFGNHIGSVYPPAIQQVETRYSISIENLQLKPWITPVHLGLFSAATCIKHSLLSRLIISFITIP